MTIWIGRSLSVSNALSRSGSRNIRVSRLYDGTRRAKPKVTTSGLSALATQSVDMPRLALLAASRSRVMAIRSSRIRRLSAQIVLLSTSASAFQS